MSLTGTSDDSLELILSFLMGEDVMRLMAVGSKTLIARVAHKTTNLVWNFIRTSYFPSSSYTFANLRSLSVKIGGYRSYLSLHGHPLLPLEPMSSLESLDLSFLSSHLVFAPATSPVGMSLSSLLPRLTSLAIRSDISCAVPDDWAESLPKGLTSLTMLVRINNYERTLFIDASSLNHLPSGMQHLKFGSSCSIGAGKVNFERFRDLRTLELADALSWDALDSLPNTLQTLLVWNSNRDFSLPTKTFPLSKLPPNIRSLDLSGAALQLDFDTMAPLTLEEVQFGLEEDVPVENFVRFFQTKNLRVVHGVGSMTAESLALFPNLQIISGLGNITTLTTFEILPRNFESLFLQDSNRVSPAVSFKNLPPALKTLYSPILCYEDVSDLPKTLTTLKFHNFPRSTPIKVPAAVWRQLPSQLRRLEVDLCFFESEECFHALPEKLQHLEFDFTGSQAHFAMSEIATFPTSIQESVQKLYFSLKHRPLVDAEYRADFMFPKLSPFTSLTDLRFALYTVINSSTLANLPKTLTELQLNAVEFENFGLPVGQNIDWKEGALSRLPEGLRALKLQYAKESSVAIDFKLFSNLPRRLDKLYLSTKQEICENPKSFISMLPRRLSELSYIYKESKNEGESSEDGDPTNNAKRELKEAIDEYFSDPFWGGHRFAVTTTT